MLISFLFIDENLRNFVENNEKNLYTIVLKDYLVKTKTKHI